MKKITIMMLFILVSASVFTDVIFTEDFEGSLTGWTFGTNGQTNKWECGSATSYNGSKSAYISHDGGTSATYDKSAESTSWLEREIHLEGYNSAYLSFYWKCDGQGGVIARDYGEVYINDGVDHLVSDAREFVNQSSWTHKTNIDLSDYVGFTVTLKFKWTNNSSSGDDPPFCIDDIEITGSAGHDFAVLSHDEDSRSMRDTTVVAGSDVTFHIAVKNLGTISESAPIKWICTGGSPTIDNENTGVLSPNEIEHHIFSTAWTAPSSAGTYTVTFSTELLNDNNSANDETSVQIEVVELASLPLTENFDGVTHPNLPEGWDAENSNEDSHAWYTNTNYPHSSPNCCYISGSSLHSMDDWLFSPPMEMESGKTYRISFWAAISDPNDEHKLEILWGNSRCADGMSAGPIFDEVIDSNIFEEKICYLSPSSDGIYYVGWHGYSDANSSYLFLDDITIKEVQNHDFATLGFYENAASMRDIVVATNETLALNIVVRNEGATTESAPVKWICTGGTPTSGNETTSVLTQDGTENHNFSIDWTAPATAGTYQLTFYTELATDGDSSNDSTTIEISVVNPQTVPVSENFDSVSSPEIPFGWSVENKNRDYHEWITDIYGDHSEPNSICLWQDFFLQADDWFFSCPLSLEAGKTYNINFWYSTGGIEQILQVYWGTSPTSDGMVFGQIYSDTTNEAGFTEGNAMITPGTSGTYYIGWRGNSEARNPSSYLSVDDISITEFSFTHDFATLSYDEDFRSMKNITVLAGSSVNFHIVAENLGTTTESAPIKWTCNGGTPTNDSETTSVLTSNETELHTFTPDWTAPSTAGIYTVNFFTDLATDEDTSNDTTSVQITVLEECSLPLFEDFENGLGKFDNEGNNDSDWSLNSALYYSSGNSVWNSYGADEENILLQSCAIDLTGIQQPYLKFHHIAKTEAENDRCYVEISLDLGETWNYLSGTAYEGVASNYANCEYFDESSYEDWGTANEVPDNSWWKQETFDLSAYEDETIMLRFRIVSNSLVNKYGWLLDDISVKELSTPEEAYNPQPQDYETDICICNDKLTWKNGFGTDSVDLYFGTDQSAVNNLESSAKVIDNVNTESYTIPNILSSYTTYYWRVVTRNSSGENAGSVWRFTTVYTEDSRFEDFESGDFSSFSWTQGGDADWNVQSVTVHEGTYSAQSGTIGNNQTSELSIGLDIENDGFISFYKKISSEANFDKLIFYIDGVEQDSWSGEIDWSFERFPVSAGYRTFTWSYEKNVSGSSGNDSVWLDCINFPAFEQTHFDPPQNLQIEIVENDVVLSWNEVSGATLYKIYYSEDTDPNSFTLLETTPDNSYTDVGGALNEKRFYYVTAQ